jgi:23S rRNA (cytosine1962-C5)-methyltransferase
MKNNNLTVRPWRDYELLDSGDSRKLERFGKFILARPETQAIWQPSQPELWKRADAEFVWGGNGKSEDVGKSGAQKGGAWRKKNIQNEWELGWNQAKFVARFTSFKHVGIFPEQATNWEWIAEQVGRLAAGRESGLRGKHAAPPSVLNLFGYTGVASIVAAQAGARVTHVDASRQSNEWAKENARLSEVPADEIRYIFDDTLAFVLRELRRGASYDGVILDPPAFGRGAKGEIWRIEEHLPRLLEALAKITSKKPGAFFLLNGYAAGYSAWSFEQAVEGAFPEVKKILNAEFGELHIEEKNSGRCVPSGIYVRFAR